MREGSSVSALARAARIGSVTPPRLVGTLRGVPLDLSIVRPGSPTSPLSEAWASAPDTTDPAFCAWLSDLSAAAAGGQLALAFPPVRAPEVSEPGRWNVDGDVRFQAEFPLSWDTLDPRSPNFALKQFSKRLYLERASTWLDTLPPGAQALDLGGGIGRFACEWLDRGLAVTLADPNPRALELALGHLARRGGRFELWNLAAESLRELPRDTFHLVSALEVLCYLSEPQDGLREAARVLRPGGLLLCSVESGVGSLDPAIAHSAEAIATAAALTEHAIPGDTWVRYFTADTLSEAISRAGLEVLAVHGTHYLTDGPLHRLVDFERLADPAYADALLAFDRLLESTSGFGGAARALLAIARKPDPHGA